MSKKKAPKFQLPDQEGKVISSSDFEGKWVLIYFYPKDDTPGCTKEACGLRDWFSLYKKAGIEIVGISKDSVKSHARFAGKFDLPFTLLSDESTEVHQAFGVWAKKKFMGREYMGALRQSFLINPKWEIVHFFENVKPETHAEDVIKVFQEIKKNEAND